MRLFLFNPENDLALANGDANFIPPRSARVMAADLSLLPMWWAGAGDAVRTPARREEAERAVQALQMPEVRLWCAGEAPPEVQEVCPWGWSPMLRNSLLKQGVAAGCLPTDEQVAVFRRLSSRQTAVELLADFAREAECHPGLWAGRWCGASQWCRTEAEIVALLEHHPDVLLKAPWSGSGKGLRLGRGGWKAPLSGWCRRLLAAQGGVVVEPRYEKVEDWAMEFSSDGAGTVTYQGLSQFVTSEQGAYMGSRVASEEAMEARLRQRVPAPQVAALRHFLTVWLTQRLGSTYRGDVGVDLMVCRGGGGSVGLLHPCVEVNVRTTMGRVAVALAHRLAEGSEAEFRVDYAPRSADLLAEHERRLREQPLRQAGGRWVEGYRPLTPVGPQTHYRAWMLVRRAGQS